MSAAFSAPKACSICSNSESMCRPTRAGAADHEICAAEPFAVVGRRVRRRFQAKGASHFARDISGQRVASGRIEGEEFVDRQQLHKARLLGPERGDLLVEKAADLLRSR